MRDLLENCMNDGHPWPPESNGVYVVSKRCWTGFPTKDDEILYVGGNTSNSALFLTRVGTLSKEAMGRHDD